MSMISMPHTRRGPFELSPFEFTLLRNNVLNIIKAKSFTSGDFLLASGRRSDYYLDMKPTMFDPEGIDGLAQMVLHRLAAVDIDYVGGMALGAVPLVCAVSMRSIGAHKPLPGFFVRKVVKDHGTMKLIEGFASADALKGKRVAILDDVTTTGGSAMGAVEAATDAGATVVLVLSIVDREEGAAEFYRQQGIPFEWFFQAREFKTAH
jgi:orotate phosphoribosyltransferase